MVIFQKILVADFDPINQKLARIILEKQGYLVVTESKSSKILKRVEEESFSLILTELQIPELNGLEFARLLRASGKINARTPIVAVTASPIIDNKDKIKQAGMNDYLAKPYQCSDLIQTVKKALAPSSQI